MADVNVSYVACSRTKESKTISEVPDSESILIVPEKSDKEHLRWPHETFVLHTPPRVIAGSRLYRIQIDSTISMIMK